VASFLVDRKADVNTADAQRFTPLFWAVDRRNMETAPNFPWMVTADPMPLIRQLLDAGADPNALVNHTPRAGCGKGSPRIVFATALMRAAFAPDLDLVTLLLERGADPSIISSDGETMVSAAAGLAFIQGYHRDKGPAARLQVVRKFVELGNDVNQPDDYGITPLMAAGNYGDVPVIQYLIDVGADLAAHDLGKKNDGAFGSSVEPLMPVDYAVGVGTFVPNNAVIIHEEAVALMARVMKERGIVHTTSECTLRGFTCSQAEARQVVGPARNARLDGPFARPGRCRERAAAGLVARRTLLPAPAPRIGRDGIRFRRGVCHDPRRAGRARQQRRSRGQPGRPPRDRRVARNPRVSIRREKPHQGACVGRSVGR